MSQTAYRFSSEEILSVLALSKDATAIYTTPALVIQAANDAMIGFWGKDRTVIGKTFEQAVPELVGQPFFGLLREVWRTGITYEAKNTAAQLRVGGKLQWFYYDFVYRAIKNENGEIYCILHTATDVTERMRALEEGQEREQSLYEEVVITNEELAATNEELIESKQYLELLNKELDGRVVERTNEFLSAKAEAENQRDALRKLVMTTHYALVILKGREMVVDIANQQVANLWNKTLDEISGRPLLDVLPELRGQPFPLLLEKVYDTGIPHGQQEEAFLLDTPGGKLQKYVSFYYDPMLDKDGNVSGVIAGAEDITEQVLSRKELEKRSHSQQLLNEELAETQRNLERSINQLFESEHRIRGLVTSAPFPISVYSGKEMRIILANQAIIDVWGKGNDVVGKLYSEILPELDSQEIFSQLDRVYASGIPFHARNRPVDLVIGGKIQPFYFNYSFTPLYDTDGAIYGVMNTAADVTDLVMAKQKVEQSEKTLHSMILQAPVAMCILLGPEHIIAVANELIIELWGKPSTDVLNKPVFEALPDARDQGLEILLSEVYHKGESFSASERPVSLVRNGRQETIYQNFVYEPYRDAEGIVLGIIAITIDVTRQVQAKQKIEKSEAELLEVKKRLELELEAGKLVQRQKDDFIGMASHELKTPLTSLTAIVQLLNRKFEGNEDPFISGALDKANIQVKKMSNLINGFLNISRLESGKIVIHKQRFRFDELIGEMIDEIQLIAQGHTIHLNNAEPIEILADRDKIGSVVSNLLSNAVKYSPKGKHIYVHYQKVDGMITVAVEDEGMGIKEQDIERLFDRYYRVESSHTQHISGFGIGLYLSAEIIRQHDGRIWVKSESGKGSVFYFKLPVV